MPANVAILIVTYNSSEQIDACLGSVLSPESETSREVIVLDNGSSDDTVTRVRSRYPQVRLITPERNLGFAAGVNEAARHTDADHLLLLNPDTIVLENAVDVIVEFSRTHPHYGLYGGRTLTADGRLEPSSCWGQPTLWSLFTFACGLSTAFRRNRFFDPESLGTWPRDTVRQVGVITGCFLLIRREAWQRLGGFDERYFMYGEDTDLSARAWGLGYKPVIVPQARLIHEVGRSSRTPIHKTRLLFRGKATFVRSHWRGLAGKLALGLLLAGVGARSLPAWILGRKEHRWRVMWRERGDWTRGYPQPLKVASMLAELNKS